MDTPILNIIPESLHEDLIKEVLALIKEKEKKSAAIPEADLNKNINRIVDEHFKH